MPWTAPPAAGLSGNLTPLPQVGATAAQLYARRYAGFWGSNPAVLTGTPTGNLGPASIDYGLNVDSGQDGYSIGWTGYVWSPVTGTFSATNTALGFEDAVAIWIGRHAVAGFTLANIFAGRGVVSPNAGTATIRSGFTPVRVAFGDASGPEYAGWTITFPPGASFVHATAALGF